MVPGVLLGAVAFAVAVAVWCRREMRAPWPT